MGERGTKRVLEYARLAMGFANVRAGTRVLTPRTRCFAWRPQSPGAAIVRPFAKQIAKQKRKALAAHLYYITMRYFYCNINFFTATLMKGKRGISPLVLLPLKWLKCPREACLVDGIQKVAKDFLLYLKLHAEEPVQEGGHGPVETAGLR